MTARRPRPRLTVAGLVMGVAVIAAGLAAVRWAAGRHPEAARRIFIAAHHAETADTWRSAHDNFLGPPPPGNPEPHYEWSGHGPSGVLADPLRYDAVGRPWEYSCGWHRWLGPADPARSEASLRDDFLALCLEKAAFQDRMAARWSWAARFPWVTIDPDPPGPPLAYDPPGDSW